MLYTLTILRSYKGHETSEHLTFTSAGQIADYIRSYIDQSHIQEMLSRIEYHELDSPKDDFLPLPHDIDAACEKANNQRTTLFEAGEDVKTAKYFGVVFQVSRS